MSLRCFDCDAPATHCDCAIESDGRFAPACLHDISLTAAQERARALEVRIESDARTAARAFVKTGGTVLVVDAALVAEARETLLSIARWTNDRAEKARIEAIVVGARVATARAA